MKLSNISFVFISYVLCTCVLGLYEDQIGKFDWRLQLIGKPVRVAFDASSDSTSQTQRIFVATEQNVLAALNWLTGEIVWRHVFEQSEAGKVDDLLLLQSGDVVTLSGGGQYLMNWERHRGSLRSSAVVSTEYCKSTKMAAYKSGSVAVLSPCSCVLSAFDRTGSQLWAISLQKQPGGDNIRWYDFVASDGGSELIVLGQDTKSSSVVVVFVSSSGNVVKSITKNVSYNEHRVKILSNPTRLVWLDGGTLNSLVLSSDAAASSTPISAVVSGVTDTINLRLQAHPNGHLVLTNDAHMWFMLKGDQSKEARLEKVDGTAVGFVNSQEGVPFAAVSTVSARGGFSVRFYNAKSGKAANEWDIVVPSTDVLAAPEKICPFFQLKNDRSTYASGIIVLGSDHSLALISQPGKISWNRQEALASILSVEMLDLPLSEAQANIEEEFSTNGTVLAMFIRRMTSQIFQIQRVLLTAVNELFGLADLLGKSDNLVASLSSAGGRSSERTAVERAAGGKSQRFERDYFNLHKIIVVATAAGKLYGLDNVRGTIVWQKYLDNLVPYAKLHSHVLPLYILRTTAHYPFPAEAAIVGRHKISGNGMLVAFNPITGADFQILPLPSSVKQSVILPVSDEHEVQGVGIITEGLKVHIYPASVASAFSTSLQKKPFVAFLAGEDGLISGHRVSGINQKSDKDFAVFELEPAWKANLPLEKQGKLVRAAMKRFTEQVHSQGRVLGDRSVLYKYVNPNLVAAVGESVDVAGKGQMNIYLFDAVTGDVIFNGAHRRVTGPYHLVHCENWIVYTYWNEKARRNEVAVLELYEGKEQADPSKFSSLNPPQPPIVMRQAYVFPQGISALAVTDTEKGITSRHLLVSMPFGGILELSKAFLDPRRVLTPTMEQREEGLYPYIPDLPIVTEQIINYNQSVYNIRGIHTAPSGLESTSLILAYGLDLYFTRVTPSGTFDILKDDFDHWFIGCVLLGLFVSSAVAKKLARHRDVKMAWR